jgi:octaprenyl-diphosphate synthase
VDYAYETARQLVKKAQDELSIIPDSIYKTALLELGDYVVKRDR